MGTESQSGSQILRSVTVRLKRERGRKRERKREVSPLFLRGLRKSPVSSHQKLKKGSGKEELGFSSSYTLLMVPITSGNPGCNGLGSCSTQLFLGHLMPSSIELICILQMKISHGLSHLLLATNNLAPGKGQVCSKSHMLCIQHRDPLLQPLRIHINHWCAYFGYLKLKLSLSAILSHA